MTNNLLYFLLKTARPRQWIKNFALFTPLAFSGFFFYNPVDAPPYFLTVGFAFLIFCILTSSVYTINDIVDVENDRKHPFKKKRPIASGDLPIPIAIFAAITGLSIVFLLSLTLPTFFRLLTGAYFLLQMIYATKFKNIPIIDVISIAFGFLIRIYAGSVVVNLHMSVWFLLTIVSASLFLAVGKRQSERTLLGEANLGATRKSLEKYSQRLLDQYTSMFANATWLTYALFTFQNYSNQNESASSRFPELYTFLPKTLQSEKLLMLTLPFVIYGVMRYIHLIYEQNQGESPEVILLRDKPLLVDIIIFGILTMAIIYL